MSRYSFRAAQPDGRITAGMLAAGSAAEADAALLAQGLQPLELAPAEDAKARQRRVSQRSLTTAMRSIATLVSLGVPLDRAMATTAALPMEKELTDALQESRRLLAEGHTLSAAFEGTGVPLAAALLGLLRAGERGSQLGAALQELANELERDADLRRRIHQAIAYPLVLLAAGGISIGVIAGVIVPRFAEVLADLDQALPVTTRLLLGASVAFRSYGWLLLLIVGACAVGFSAWRASPGGARTLSRWLLKLPLVGGIRLGFASARVAHTLGALLGSGAPMLMALRAASEAAGDPTMRERLERVRVRVSRGESLSPALEAEQALAPGPLQLVAVGEGSGQLAEMSKRAGELAAADAEAGLRTVVGLLEPGLVLLLGGFVAFVALALLQAVYSLRPVG